MYVGHKYPLCEESHIPYELTEAFWFIIATRFAFLVTFIATVSLWINFIFSILKNSEIKKTKRNLLEEYVSDEILSSDKVSQNSSTMENIRRFNMTMSSKTIHYRLNVDANQNVCSHKIQVTKTRLLIKVLSLNGEVEIKN